MYLAGLIVKLAKHRKPLWIPYRGTKVLIDDPLIPLRTLDMLIRGVYEADEGRVLERLGKEGRLTRADKALELGAGAGVIALQIAKWVGPENYLGFEANPAALNLAQRNFALNGWVANIRRKLVLPAPSGPRTFSVATNFTASGLVPQGDTIGTLSVEAEAWADVMAEFDPTFLLMDIEGGEKELIEGIEYFGRIHTIVMENHYFGLDAPVYDAMIAKLASAGFVEDKAIIQSTSVHVFVRATSKAE